MVVYTSDGEHACPLVDIVEYDLDICISDQLVYSVHLSDGTIWVHNCEQKFQVPYCPFTGIKAQRYD